MSEETLSKIWVPLFTTKAKGMGFGLSICRRIVEAHGGKIIVKSKIAEGTEFRIILPITRK
jgi:signal transduction histidine kinase